MSSTLMRFALDPTGFNPNNLVLNEPHILDSNVQVRAVAPIYGPFYSNSNLNIIDADTNKPLTASQYSCVELLQDATIKFGQGIYSIILIKDPTVSSRITVSYQALGGNYQNSAQAVIRAYQTILADSRNVNWADVLNKPVAYPPSLHQHLLSDVTGFESLVAALERVRNAIVLSDVPTIQAMVDWVWASYDKIENLPVATQDDIESGIPAKKYITYDLLLRLLNIYKGGSNINVLVDNRRRIRANSILYPVVQTYGFPNNSMLYWSISHISTTEEDFVANTGSFVVNNSTARFGIQIANIKDETAIKDFKIQIRETSPLGKIVALTDTIQINFVKQENIIDATVLMNEDIFAPGVNLNSSSLYWMNSVKANRAIASNTNLRRIT